MVNSLAIARALHSNAKYTVAYSYRICALTPKEEAATLSRNREEPSIVTKKKLFVLVRTKNTLTCTKEKILSVTRRRTKFHS